MQQSDLHLHTTPEELNEGNDRKGRRVFEGGGKGKQKDFRFALFTLFRVSEILQGCSFSVGRSRFDLLGCAAAIGGHVPGPVWTDRKLMSNRGQGSRQLISYKLASSVVLGSKLTTTKPNLQTGPQGLYTRAGGSRSWKVWNVSDNAVT